MPASSIKGNVTILPEPDLEFRFGQKTADPHAGLSLFGPFDADLPSHPSSIPYGLISTPSGVELFARWSRLFNSGVAEAMNSSKPRLWPAFPGFDAAFCSSWPSSPAWIHNLDRETVLRCTRDMDANSRTYRLVDMFVEGLEIVSKRDEPIGVVLCIIPDEIWKNCRPKSVVADGTGHRLSQEEVDRRARTADLFGGYDPVVYRMSVDFRRQLKARAMKYGLPLQIIRESTLTISSDGVDPPTGLSPLSDRAWNLGTTLYYKAGGKPWRLATAREGVCYLGIAFRQATKYARGRTACCAAQMFLDSGDGFVFMGETGPWYSPRKREFHLSKKAARDLMEGALTTYRKLGGPALKEIFLHSRSTIDQDEFDGYREGLPNSINLVGIRVRLDRQGIRLYRPGSRPVIRGTFLETSPRSGLLWGSGFKASLATYDGWEVPAPLSIDLQHGDSAMRTVAQDILGLTKLNYNACRLGESQPVTVGFSNMVGEILVSNPPVEDRKPNFKFYL